jgi:pimeloyl-ACP methyl ester carboxylesterase
VSARAAQAGTPGGSGAFATVNDHRLWYVDAGGAGPVVVLLHAASGSSLLWEKQVPALTARGYRTIVYDRLGWGRSTADAGAAPGTAAADLAALLRLLGVDRAHLVGTAAGAIVAIDFALSFPGQVRSLVLANTIAGVQDEEYLALGRRLRPSPQFEALPVELRELGPSFRARDATGTARWVDLSAKSRPEGRAPVAQAPANRITFDRLASIRAPVLLMTGGADLYAPPPVQALFKARLPQAEVRVDAESGHSMFWEAPDTFNDAVAQFLARY